MAENELDGARAQLVDDFRKVVSDSEALLRAMADVTGERAAVLRESVEETLTNARERLRELQGVAGERAAAAARVTDEYVHDNPWTAIGIAAGVGVLVGVLIATRR